MDIDVESTIEDNESKKIESSHQSNIKEKSITPKKELPNLEIKVEKLKKEIIPLELVESSKKILSEKSESKLKSPSNTVSATPPKMSPTSIIAIITMKNTAPKKAHPMNKNSTAEGAEMPKKSANQSNRPIATPFSPCYLT